MSPRGRLALAGALLASAAVGYWLGGRQPAAPSPAPAEGRREVVIAGGQGGAGLDRAALRAELRALLPADRDQDGECPSPADLAAEEDALAAPSDAQLASFAAAEQLIGEAVARGRWDADDAAALRPLLAQISDGQRADLLAVLFPAVNEGRVELATGGPPF